MFIGILFPERLTGRSFALTTWKYAGTRNAVSLFLPSRVCNDRKYIIEEDFPIFFNYLKRINYPFEWINNKRSYILFTSNRDYDSERSTIYTPAKDFYIYVGDAR